MKKVVHENSDKNYILQIEFQATDEPKMVYRINEYCGILLRKYEIEIRQYVIFIDTGQAKMQTTLRYPNAQFQFQLLNLQDFDYHQFVNSDKPEEVILAILANLGIDKSETVVTMILTKLKSLKTGTLKREKCFKQLEVLSNLRNLQSEIIKQLEIMALTYDLEKDIRFQQGISKGISKGETQGIEKTNILTVKRMLADQLPVEQIAKYVEVSIEFVQKIADSIKK